MMFKKVTIATIIAATTLFTVSMAQAGPIEDRKAKMKEVGKNLGIIGKMVKGETAFDGAAALAAYIAMGDGFNAAGQAFGNDLVAAANAGAPADVAALTASFGNVAKNCKACHTDYRIKKN